MKKIRITLIGCLSLCIGMGMTITSCNDPLDLESKTAVTYDYLITTAEGLGRAVIGLYDEERNITSGNDHNLYAVTMCDYNTDIMLFRAGTSASLARLLTLLPSDADISHYWTHNYTIIGKCNEIIAAAEKMGVDNEAVKEAWAEAKFFRGRAYFLLWQRYENIYLNTEPTTVDNLQREFTPAAEEEVLSLITTDLDDAISGLDWIIPNEEYGRLTKAVAKHVRAQVAMWQKDYDRAIKECEDIINNGNYTLLESVGKVFDGPDLRNSEVLWSYQFSKNIGGGGTGTPLMGHRMSLITTTRYQSNAGCTFEAAQGGYGWGRVYPNSYLLSLYDTIHDNRYKELFKFDFYYNKPTDKRYGTIIPKNLYGKSAGYAERLHPMSMKFFDKWTNADQPDRTSSFKDLIVYRLAETYLICAEAYYHRDGSSPEALKYYNATWKRAGNPEEKGPLTLDKIIDEYARELNFEGVRWALLKRLSKLGYNNEGTYAGKDQMVDRVHDHYGDSRTEDKYLDKDYIENRQFLNDPANAAKLKEWPIPQSQLDLMEGTFPQNEPWR